MTLTFTMEELKEIGKNRKKLVKLYKYYFPDESVQRRKTEDLILAIFRKANVFEPEMPLPEDVPMSVRVRRIYDQQKNQA